MEFQDWPLLTLFTTQFITNILLLLLLFVCSYGVNVLVRMSNRYFRGNP